MLKQRLLSILALVLVFCLVEQVSAQAVQTRAPTSQLYQDVVRGQDKPNYDLRDTFNRSIRGSFGRSGLSVLGSVSSEPVKKPFTYVSQRPTVSPYLNLLRQDTGEAAPNYYSLVKPQIDQIDFNQQQMRQNQQMARRMQGIQSRPAYPVAGSQYLIPTGHQAVFMNYLHYYPMPRRR